METVNEVQYCESCGQPIKNYTVTLTKRNLIWLFALGYLARKTEDKYVNYKDVHNEVAKHFGKMIDDKWRPMVLSSYSKMGLQPWNLIEKRDLHSPKYDSRGEWKLTKTGINFINGRVALPEKAYYNHQGCYKMEGSVFAYELKNINFDDLVKLFKSF